MNRKYIPESFTNSGMAKLPHKMPLERIEAHLINLLKEASVDPAVIFAFEITALWVTKSVESTLSKQSLRRWDNALAAFEGRCVPILEHPDVLRADAFAEKAHSGQTRKWNSNPYIVHPRRVADRVSKLARATVGMVMAAKLHDVREDCGISYITLLETFGKVVADLVEELTAIKDPALPRSERKTLEAKRLSTISQPAKQIKLCDRIDNLLDLGPDEAFTKLYAKESLIVAEAIGDADAELKTQLIQICEKILNS